jgi:hypothetical protein
MVISWWSQQLGPRVNIIEVAIDKKKTLLQHTFLSMAICLETHMYQVSWRVKQGY